ncbi:MAG: HipA family kinase [Flavobacterium sp.]
MQKLKLINIDGFLEGGSSKPLLITALNEHKVVGQYVMKLFKKDFVEQNYSVAKEIFINELSKEFNLESPDYALIKIDHSILADYFDDNFIKKLDEGYKYCSKYYGQYLIFNPLVSLSFIKEYDIENLFAFDNITINADRGGFRDKPNLLINDSNILLIDHELTIPFINNSSEHPNYYNYLRNYPYEKHILTKQIKGFKNKDSLFAEFFEMLKTLNINRFSLIFDELDSYGIKYGDRNKIYSYLNWIKSNHTFISNHLIGIIK